MRALFPHSTYILLIGLLLLPFVSVGASEEKDFSDFSFTRYGGSGGGVVNDMVVTVQSLGMEQWNNGLRNSTSFSRYSTVSIKFSEPISSFSLKIEKVYKGVEFLGDFNIGNPTELTGTLVRQDTPPKKLIAPHSGKSVLVTSSEKGDHGYGVLTWNGLNTQFVSFSILRTKQKAALGIESFHFERLDKKNGPIDTEITRYCAYTATGPERALCREKARAMIIDNKSGYSRVKQDLGIELEGVSAPSSKEETYPKFKIVDVKPNSVGAQLKLKGTYFRDFDEVVKQVNQAYQNDTARLNFYVKGDDNKYRHIEYVFAPEELISPLYNQGLVKGKYDAKEYLPFTVSYSREPLSDDQGKFKKVFYIELNHRHAINEAGFINTFLKGVGSDRNSSQVIECGAADICDFKIYAPDKSLISTLRTEKPKHDSGLMLDSRKGGYLTERWQRVINDKETLTLPNYLSLFEYIGDGHIDLLYTRSSRARLLSFIESRYTSFAHTYTYYCVGSRPTNKILEDVDYYTITDYWFRERVTTVTEYKVEIAEEFYDLAKELVNTRGLSDVGLIPELVERYSCSSPQMQAIKNLYPKLIRILQKQEKSPLFNNKIMLDKNANVLPLHAFKYTDCDSCVQQITDELLSENRYVKDAIFSTGDYFYNGRWTQMSRIDIENHKPISVNGLFTRQGNSEHLRHYFSGRNTTTIEELIAYHRMRFDLYAIYILADRSPSLQKADESNADFYQRVNSFIDDNSHILKNVSLALTGQYFVDGEPVWFTPFINDLERVMYSFGWPEKGQEKQQDWFIVVREHRAAEFVKRYGNMHIDQHMYQYMRSIMGKEKFKAEREWGEKAASIFYDHDSMLHGQIVSTITYQNVIDHFNQISPDGSLAKRFAEKFATADYSHNAAAVWLGGFGNEHQYEKVRNGRFIPKNLDRIEAFLVSSTEQQ